MMEALSQGVSDRVVNGEQPVLLSDHTSLGGLKDG